MSISIDRCRSIAYSLEAFYYAGDGIAADVYSVLCDAWECGTTRTKEYIAKRLMSSMAEVQMALKILYGRTAVRQIGEGYTAF